MFVFSVVMKSARTALVKSRLAEAWNSIDKEKCRAAYIQLYMNTGEVNDTPPECYGLLKGVSLTYTETRNESTRNYIVSTNMVHMKAKAFSEFSSSQ